MYMSYEFKDDAMKVALIIAKIEINSHKNVKRKFKNHQNENQWTTGQLSHTENTSKKIGCKSSHNYRSKS